MNNYPDNLNDEPEDLKKRYFPDDRKAKSPIPGKKPYNPKNLEDTLKGSDFPSNKIPKPDNPYDPKGPKGPDGKGPDSSGYGGGPGSGSPPSAPASAGLSLSPRKREQKEKPSHVRAISNMSIDKPMPHVYTSEQEASE